jgi:hypothetical protein
MNPLKTQSIFKADTPSLSCPDKSKVPYKENAAFKDRFALDAL